MQLPYSQKQIPIGYEAGLRAHDRHTHACAVSRYEHAVREVSQLAGRYYCVLPLSPLYPGKLSASVYTWRDGVGTLKLRRHGPPTKIGVPVGGA